MGRSWAGSGDEFWQLLKEISERNIPMIVLALISIVSCWFLIKRHRVVVKSYSVPEKEVILRRKEEGGRRKEEGGRDFCRPSPDGEGISNKR
ncbi:hypothetical protein GCM10023331_35000 [Algivirga pacifica]|uniref:Uncharacterized protein n=1 Tax=Algivirga pacifica TaxID=1162670 RepID=A0ABP9DKH1_9BACT